MNVVKDPSPTKPKRKLLPIPSLVLQLVRELRGMTQEELGAEAGFETSTISAFERGKEVPGPETLDRLMEALGVRQEVLQDLLALAEEIRSGEAMDRPVVRPRAHLRQGARQHPESQPMGR